MITDFARDQLFTIAWFGLMAFAWLGWAQEDPPASWRLRLGLGSVAGLCLAIGFGIGVVSNWSTPTALDDQYHWFGLLGLVELVAAGVGCLVLARRRCSHLMAWWVALVVASHFVPLAWLLNDPTIALIGVAQGALLLWIRPRLRQSREPSSRWVGPIMGVSLLAFALLSACVFLAEHLSR